MKSSISIRRATEADCQPLLDLWLALLEEQESMDERFRSAEDAAERWRNDYEEWLRDDEQRLFLAEEGGEVVGYVSACRWFTPPIYRASREVYVEELYVTPDARRRGVGRMLMAAVREWADEEEAERLRVGVLAQNSRGRAFWERLEGRPLALTLTIELDRPSSDIEKNETKGRLGF